MKNTNIETELVILIRTKDPRTKRGPTRFLKKRTGADAVGRKGPQNTHKSP